MLSLLLFYLCIFSRLYIISTIFIIIIFNVFIFDWWNVINRWQSTHCYKFFALPIATLKVISLLIYGGLNQTRKLACLNATLKVLTRYIYNILHNSIHLVQSNLTWLVNAKDEWFEEISQHVTALCISLIKLINLTQNGSITKCLIL